MNIPIKFPYLKGWQSAMGMDANIYMTVTVSHHDWLDTDSKGFPNRVDNTTHTVISALLGVSEFTKATEGDFKVQVPVAYFRKDHDLHHIIGEVLYGADPVFFEDWKESCYGSGTLSLQHLQKVLGILEDIGERKAYYDGEPAGHRNFKWLNAVQHLTRIINYVEKEGIHTSFEYTAG